MFLFDWLRDLFAPQVQPTGLLLDNPSLIEQLPQHELFVAGPVDPILSWRSFCPSFRSQGPLPFCTAFAATAIKYMFDKREKGESPIFSPSELFYRSGGQLFGNYLLATAKAMQQAIVLDQDVPTIIPDRWDAGEYNLYKLKSVAHTDALDRGKSFRINSPAIVKTDDLSLKAALSSSPLMIAIGLGKGYYLDTVPLTTNYSTYHCVPLIEIREDGSKVIFDSLSYHAGFDGFKVLPRGYQVLTAISFVDLPSDWTSTQAQAKEVAFGNALNHFGSQRVLPVEQSVALQLTQALKNNPSISSAMGAQWTVCINAISYGGYTVTDILNHFTNLHRTGHPIFNLNKTRSQQ